VAENRGTPKRQTRRSANTTIAIVMEMEMESRTNTKKMKIVKKDSPFQFRQNVVVSHGKQASQQTIKHRSFMLGITSISQSIDQ
jgi:hypothetical protein